MGSHFLRSLLEFCNTPFYQDVTAEYTATSDVEIEMLRSPSQKRDFAYLCVFDNQKWEPIHFAPLKRGKARFTDMGRDIVYLPGYYIEGEIEQSGYPFILDVFGEIHPLIPDTIHTHPLRLERKYPISNRLIDHSNKLLAGCIQASADSTFTDPVTFHIIARNTQGAPDTVTVEILALFVTQRFVLPNRRTAIFQTRQSLPSAGTRYRYPRNFKQCFRRRSPDLL